MKSEKKTYQFEWKDLIYLAGLAAWPVLSVLADSISWVQEYYEFVVFFLFWFLALTIVFCMCNYFFKMSIEKFLLYGCAYYYVKISLGAVSPRLLKFVIFLGIIFCIMLVKSAFVKKIHLKQILFLMFLSPLLTLTKIILSQPCVHNFVDPKISFNFMKKPNIYFFIIDKYPHYFSLKNRGFSNDHFFDQLKSLGGIVSHRYISNYQNTSPSIQTIFHMRYFEDNQMPYLVDTFYSCKNNQALSILKKNGYHIMWVPPAYSGYSLMDADERYKSDTLHVSEITFTLCKLILPPRIGLQNMTYVFPNQLIQFMCQKKENPKFVFFHCMQVHDVVDPDGPTISYSNKFLFNNVIKSFNNQFIELLSAIRKNDPSGIIIAMSDHGGFNQERGLSEFKKINLKNPNNISFFIDNFGGLSCVFIPNLSKRSETYKAFTEFRTGVNTFRVLFAYLSNKEAELIPDRSFITRTDNDEKESNMNATVDANNIKEVSSYYPKVIEYIKEQEKLMEESKK